MNHHRNLVAWRHCHALAIEVHRACGTMRGPARFELGSQLRRAATSACANIAEGYARFGAAELSHGLSIALGSLAELDALLLIAKDTGLFDADTYVRLDALRDRASASVFSFRRALRRPRPPRRNTAG